MGKLIAAFIFFLGASALAIHESKPPQPREEPIAPAAVDHTPPSRAVHDEVPPWVKYATPPKPVTPKTTVVRIEPPPIERRVIITESEISVGDIPDVIDKCPDQPNDRDDNDGCPEPERDQIILFE